MEARLASIERQIENLTVQVAATTVRSPDSVQVAGAGLPRMLDFGKGECAACIEMGGIIEGLRPDYEGRAVFEIMDIEEHPEFIEQYQIKFIPTQVFLDADGKQVFRHESVLEREAVIEQLRSMGVPHPDGAA